MTNQTAEKLLRLTNKSYEKIAIEFSKSRSSLWKDLKNLGSFVKKGDKILDLGCGNGRLYELFKDKDIKYTGLDRSKNLINEARKKWPGLNFEIGDILDIKYDNEFFNSVFCIAVLQHIPSRELQIKALENIKRILKPGGTLVMTNWNLWHFTLKKKSVWKYFFEKIKMPDEQYKREFDITKKEIGFCDCLTKWKGKNIQSILYYRAFSLSQLKKLVKGAGFEIIEAYYVKHGKKVKWHQGGNIMIICRKDS